MHWDRVCVIIGCNGTGSVPSLGALGPGLTQSNQQPSLRSLCDMSTFMSNVGSERIQGKLLLSDAECSKVQKEKKSTF